MPYICGNFMIEDSARVSPVLSICGSIGWYVLAAQAIRFRRRFSFHCGNCYFRILPEGTHGSPQSYLTVHLGTLPRDRPPV